MAVDTVSEIIALFPCLRRQITLGLIYIAVELKLEIRSSPDMMDRVTSDSLTVPSITEDELDKMVAVADKAKLKA